jgi:large subunit ribosomal protein L13
VKTFTPKAGEIERKWYLIDAEGVTLGKLAVVAANLLRGKGKAQFSPHMDMGDFVIVINAEKVKVTGNKVEDKKYYRHSWYPGGIKMETFREKLEKNPSQIIELAVHGMLPKNKLHKDFLKKLKVYAGEAYPHEAQKPQKIEVK